MESVAGSREPYQPCESPAAKIPEDHLKLVFDLVSKVARKTLSPSNVHTLVSVNASSHQKLRVYMVDHVDFSVSIRGELLLDGLFVMRHINPHERAKMQDGDLVVVADKSNEGIVDLYYIPQDSKSVGHYLVNHRDYSAPRLMEYGCQKTPIGYGSEESCKRGNA